MPLKTWMRALHANPPRPKVEFNIDKSQKGNTVEQGDGLKGMEYKQVKAKSIGGARLINWDK